MIKHKTTLQKGKELESFVAQLLREKSLDLNARREIGSGSGLFKGDVSNNLGWCIECKNTKNFNWNETTKQVAREAMGVSKEVIIWHPYGRPLSDSVAVLNVNDFVDLLKTAKEPRIKEPDRETAWAIKSTIDALKRLLKMLEG